MNPMNYRQKVASDTISGLEGEHKFHFDTILDSQFKVDIREVLVPNVALMFPVDVANQKIVKNVVGGNVVWDQKYIKTAI